jgi:hypothetical protein
MSEHRLGVGVGLVSLTLMSAEILLTRVFSVVLWYHFAFFAIAVALLGFSVAAIAVHAWQHRLPAGRSPVHLAAGSLFAAASVLALAAALVHVTPDWFGSGESAFFTRVTPRLAGLFLASALPFFAGGFVVSLALARAGAVVPRIYAWDLVGAGVGCVLVIPLLDRLGGPAALVAAAAPAALAAPVFAGARSTGASDATRSALARASRVLVPALAALIVVATGAVGVAVGAFQVRFAKGLDLALAKPEYDRWNSFSAVTVFPWWPFRGWGLSPAYTGEVAPMKGLVIDMNAFTPLIAFDGDLGKVEFTRHDLSAFVFRVHPAPAHVCVVGAGGGKDVLAALASGSRRVTALEVNPLIVDDVMRGRYRSFTGDLYARPDVDAHAESARSFMRRSPDRYDVILVSMVDTSAATAGGAYVLAEHTLYTEEAFAEFFDRLAPGGILTVASVSLDGLAVGARLASVARAALRARGSDPARSVAVVETPWLAVPGAVMHDLVVKPDGFTERDAAAIARAAADMRFTVGYLAGVPGPASTGERLWIRRILTESDAPTLERAFDAWPRDLTPATDDRPFFFYQDRVRDLGHALFGRSASHLFGNGLAVLVKVLCTALVMVALVLVLPPWFAARAGGVRVRWASDLAFVACLGLGFMFLEIALIQRAMPYLAVPTHALAAVLFVVLVAGGTGSALAARLDASGVARMLRALVMYAIVLALVWDGVTRATLAWPAVARAAVLGALVVPLGLCMGVPLPSALRVAATADGARLPWLWGVNGATSVLGSVLATMVSMHAGISRTWLVGVALYTCAALLWPRVARGAAPERAGAPVAQASPTG